MKFILTIVFFLASANLFAQSEDIETIIQSGNDFYKQKQYDKAVAEYARAMALDPTNATAKFNHANALYKAGKQVDATKSFSELSALVKEKNFRSKTYYNKGVILSAQKNLEESIEAYKNALRQNHDDKEARENLQKALLELKKKTPQQDKNQDKNKDKQQNKSQSKMSPKEAEQRLNLLSQKEKEVQERLQKEKSKTGGGGSKDW